MWVILPTQQIDIMRTWEGLPGILSRLPVLGTTFAKAINSWFLRQNKLYAWPNIWANEEVVPEKIGAACKISELVREQIAKSTSLL
jgi:lipid A disaccharide synthetase